MPVIYTVKPSMLLFLLFIGGATFKSLVRGIGRGILPKVFMGHFKNVNEGVLILGKLLV